MPTIRLTDRQRLLAEEHAGLPAVVAGRLCARWLERRFYDVAVSIGGEVLCRLACTFRPERTRHGKFRLYAMKWMLKKVAELTRRLVRRWGRCSYLEDTARDPNNADSRRHLPCCQPLRYGARPGTATAESFATFYEMVEAGADLKSIRSEVKVCFATICRWANLIRETGVVYVA